MDFLNTAVDSINTLLWSYVLIVVLVGCGLYFTLTTGLVQLRMLPEMVRLLSEGIGKKTEGKTISSFQAFCVSTALQSSGILLAGCVARSASSL